MGSKSILTLKALLISTSIAAALKLSVHFSADRHLIPVLMSLLDPPYIYVLVNAIIISIVASSRFHHDVNLTAQETAVIDPIPMVYQYPEVVQEEISVAGEELSSQPFSDTWTPRIESSEKEKPLVSSRFGHRELVKGGTEGKALKVTKSKRHETLEQTWKAITERRAIPLTKHLKKSDTWENHDHQNDIASLDPPHPFIKSETFKDQTNLNQPPPPFLMSSSTRLKKEPSLGQDELNRRVEAFINKFNEEMRLQRQESLNQFKEMITRGSY